MPDGNLLVNVLRTDDLLALQFEFVNLHLDATASQEARLVRTPAWQPAFIIVHFPPQHLAEQAFFLDDTGGPPPGPVPVKALLSDPSRLVFKLPDEVGSIPYTLDALLDWTKLEPNLAPNALPPGATDGPGPVPLDQKATAMELPYRLFLSPDKFGRWTHQVSPRTFNGRTELWHTRLGTRKPEGGVRETGASVRAIGFRAGQDQFATSLTSDKLAEIVRLSSDFSISPRRPPQWQGWPLQWWQQKLQEYGLPERYIPRAIEVERLMLTSLGAWARLQSTWDYPTLNPDTANMFHMPVFSLEQWQHIATMGRDQYVRTVEKGFFCPTGHRASYETVTERQFKAIGTPGGPGAIAYLRQSKRIIVQEPEKDYDSLKEAYQHQGHEMPFRRIRLTTLVTPKLDRGVIEILDGGQPAWIRTENNEDFEFGVVAEDWDGRQVTFSMPLMFVPLKALNNTAKIEQTYREAGAPPSRKERPFDSQIVAFAPSSGTPSCGKSNTTLLKTEQVTFDAEFEAQLNVNKLPPTYPPRFLPSVKGAKVNIPAIDQLLGRAGAVEIGFHDRYLQEGMDGPTNRAEVFAKFVEVPLAFSATEAGGIAKPDMGMDGLSRLLGPVPNVGKVVNKELDIEAFKEAQLLGGIKLKDVLLPTTFVAEDFRPENLTPEALVDPKVHIKVPMLTTLAKPDAVETRYLWKPEIKDVGVLETTDAQLILEVMMLTPRDESASSSRVHGRLLHFALNFAGVLKVRFEELRFLSEQGKKPDVSAEGVELEFMGPLAFVNTLKNILPANGFSDPPSLTVRPDGIIAGYSLGVPSVGVGIFSIQNIALSSSLSVPFIDKPAGVRFAISERHHPFLVTVSLFGGGGFFALGAGAKGIEQVEAALEFGGNISLNLGIASGGVYIMAGVYFNMTGSSVALSGYLRCGGALEVLGLICISVEFFMGLDYEPESGKVLGKAALTVCVKVVFFSKSVRLTVERKFAGAAGDPTFDELVDPCDWEEYCNAFA